MVGGVESETRWEIGLRGFHGETERETGDGEENRGEERGLKFWRREGRLPFMEGTILSSLDC